MTPLILLSDRLTELREVIAASIVDAALESRGFALRVLTSIPAPNGRGAPTLDVSEALAATSYGGIPAIAQAGFAIGSADDGGISGVEDGGLDAFVAAVERVRGRPSRAREVLGSDDVAVLGFADGLARVKSNRPQAVKDAVEWLVGLADGIVSGPSWSRRMRALAADLLDERGRLRAETSSNDADALALELCLRRTWPTAFRAVGYPSRPAHQNLMARLLADSAPVGGELDRASVWIVALHVLVGEAAVGLVPGIDAVVGVLRATQAGFKRWVWEDKPRRRGIAPARWLIDEEAHVQAYLWAVLHPFFGGQLLDEQYLPGFGLKQPRYDFGIANLGLIVEVKVIRANSDFKKVEEEIARDTGLYFSDPKRFDRMVAYIYDDCDTPQPELYDLLRNALTKRDHRIVDVIVVRRPSMMPARSARRRADCHTTHK